jgi:hypothetical protein
MAITDYHKLIRDAEADVLREAVAGVPVVTVDDLDDVTKVTALPAIAVACVGPETERPELGTNQQDGVAYPTAVILLSVGVANGEKAPEVLDITAFRRLVRTLFNNKRLSAVAQVGWCEVADSGPLFDSRKSEFQKISTAMVVTAVGRFPRT